MASVVPFQKYTIFENNSSYIIQGYDKFTEEFSLVYINPSQSLEKMNLTGGDRRFKSASPPADVVHLLETARSIAVGPCLLGFISFTRAYYAVLVTKHRKVGYLFGKHKLYSVEKTELIPLFGTKQVSIESTVGELRFLELFRMLNLSKEFYYSFTYDLSHSVQFNSVKETASRLCIPMLNAKDYLLSSSQQSRFVWNLFLLEPLKSCKTWPQWSVPVIHGFLAQAICSCSGRILEITLIARRSRFFAGPRYRKRGVNEAGNVANDVETEQILYDSSSSRAIMSFLQNRSSVPLFWKQETNAILPKPPICFHRTDAVYTSTRKHFKDFYSRYGAPIVVINLMKGKKTSNESILGRKFERAIDYLNRELPTDMQLQYRNFDIKSLYK
ncbi:SacI domain-containing protein, partial [Cardiosporidium cionae]